MEIGPRVQAAAHGGIFVNEAFFKAECPDPRIIVLALSSIMTA